MPIWRIHRALDETGDSRSKLYLDMQRGLMVKPVRIGARAVGLPSDEIAAINRARIAGKSEQEIRALVDQLHAARKVAA